jgi:hypothetical protein
MHLVHTIGSCSTSRQCCFGDSSTGFVLVLLLLWGGRELEAHMPDWRWWLLLLVYMDGLQLLQPLLLLFNDLLLQRRLATAAPLPLLLLLLLRLRCK